MINPSYRALFFRLFWFTAFFLGAFVGLFSFIFLNLKYSLMNSAILGIGVGVLFGFGYGLFMATVFTVATKLIDKSKHSSATEKLLGVHQVETGVLNLSYDQSIVLCIAALENLDGCKVSFVDKDAGIVRGITKWSWESFGESILITLSENGENKSNITISSKPILKTTQVDYGKNMENIRKIRCSLKDEFVFVDGENT